MLCSTSQSVRKMPHLRAEPFCGPVSAAVKENHRGKRTVALTVFSQLCWRLLSDHSCNQKSIKWLFTFTAIRCIFLAFVSYWVPAAAAAPSAAGRACRYSPAATAEVKVREQSHNLKILPALPLLPLCHCHCASPVPRPAPNSHFSTLLFYVPHPHPCVVSRSQFAHTLCQRRVVPAEQIHFKGYLRTNIKGEYKI